MAKIVLAGGCFWGVEAYFKQLKGVVDTSVGYIDGNQRHPTYEAVCQGVASHAEACEIIYDDQIITLEKLLEHFLRFVDPFSINKQGNDIGRQYRSGVYVSDKNEAKRVETYFKSYFSEADYQRVKINIRLNLDYDEAEMYHQDYLDKNPHGYCHVNLGLAKEEEKKNA